MSVPEITVRQDTNTLKKEKNPTRLDFYKRRIAKYRKQLRELEQKFGVMRTSRRRCGWCGRARRRPTRPSTS